MTFRALSFADVFFAGFTAMIALFCLAVLLCAQGTAVAIGIVTHAPSPDGAAIYEVPHER